MKAEGMTFEEAFEFFRFKRIGPFTREIQLILIVLLYIVTIVGYWLQVQKTGKMDGYAPGVSLIFVPIYEELLFRGILLRFFERNYGVRVSVIVTSLLFGLWHLKNVFWLSHADLVKQVLYTSLAFSPLTCWITLRTRSVWPSVVLHYLNNLPFRLI